MKPRSPVVAILGHVDHGKTSLLDYIRRSHITKREHGGITQKIGAYEITLPIKGYATNKITFIDTPGHEAFSLLRARGANVADIAILIIDAKDSVMPQTIESISHIKTANIPFIVVLNKVDLPDANPDKVRNYLLKYEVITEEKGGTIPSLAISAKTGKGVDELLESLLLIASELNLQYNPEEPPLAYIIESKKDRRGVAASVIIKNGALKVGDTIFAGSDKAKVRSLINDRGEQVSRVEPSTPFEILGFNDLPEVGTSITSTEGIEKSYDQPITPAQKFDMQSLLEKPEPQKKLTIILKCDTQGALEAVTASLAKNQNIEIILSAVGDINKSDIFLAKTTAAIIIGFGVHVSNEVKELTKQEKIVIKTYNIIYQLLEELSEVAHLIHEKEIQEKSKKGEAKILATFVIEGEKVYGVKVTKGKMNLGDSIELYRGTNLIGKSRVVSLKHRAKSIEEAKKDQEAGIVLNPPLDFKVGDVIQSIL